MANFRDGTLEQGQAMPAVSQTVLLTADNVAIDVGVATMLLVGSDNTTATSRTFTLNPSTVGAGHKLVIIFNTGGSTKAQLADTGIQKLVGDWLPTQYDAIHLEFDGTNWVEIARGQNTENLPAIPLASAHILVGASTGLAADVAMSGDITITNAGVTAIGTNKVTTTTINADAVTNAKIADDAVSIENIDSGAKPIYLTVGAGIFSTLGGDANESITVTGCVGTDTAVVWVQKAGGTPRTVDTITPGTGSVAVVMSGDPSTDHKLGWLVIRAAS